jgi:hypothetical protein
MKKLLLVLTAVLMFAFIGQAQTAVDFNVNDCSGINHHLFAELDAGKIVVISFVMPCGGCIAPTQNAYSTVQGYVVPTRARLYFILQITAVRPIAPHLQTGLLAIAYP